MTKKKYQGPTNDKGRSMQKLIEAVGTVIKTKGHIGLTTTNIANAAGLSRRLITFYFSTVENLIEIYLRGKDYWLSAYGDAVEKIKENQGENTRPILERILQNQLDYLYKEDEIQKIMLWQISQSSPIMKEICDERELLSKHFFALSDRELEGKNIDLRAVSALLAAGIYYLVLLAKSTNTLFFEIDITKPEGMERIKNVISLILRDTYERAEITL